MGRLRRSAPTAGKSADGAAKAPTPAAPAAVMQDVSEMSWPQWLGAVWKRSPESVVVNCFLLYALFTTVRRDLRGAGEASIGLIPLSTFVFGAWIIAMLGCSKWCEVVLDRLAPPPLIQKAWVDFSMALEGTALVALVSATRWRVSEPNAVRFAIAGFASLWVIQFGLLFRVTQFQAGKKLILGRLHLRMLANSAVAHHLGSFLALPDPQTALFVATWRFCSITGHALPFLDRRGWQVKSIENVARFRLYTCTCVAQPLALLAAFAYWRSKRACASEGVCAASTLSALGTGLACNAAGHAAYFMHRGLILVKMLRERPKDMRDYKPQYLACTRLDPWLQLEATQLFALTASLLWLARG
ncbi:hypothetical protein M885DRAFT_566768 [Pelagophyceae sp. CCMP2097]|nr:hypothetical protein M885DRAFT_566768 [Pelagophyceae sp. CCMP2097]